MASVPPPMQITSSSVNSLSRNFTLDLNNIHVNDKAKSSKCDSRGIALTKRPHFHRQDHVIHIHPQRSHHHRRRSTYSNYDHKLANRKRRRINSMVLPTKFLLGGNINDPLNLRSLEDEEVNQRLNAFTPESSPIPLPRHKAQVQVLIPPNIYDPLNLNTGEDIEFNLASPKSRKRKRHRKSKKEQTIKDSLVDHIEPTAALSNEVEEPSFPFAEEPCDKPPSTAVSEERISNKIVSPVVPQGSPSKFYKRFHSKSISKEDEKQPASSVAPRRRRSKSKVVQNSKSVTFRKRDERFCLGNFVRNYCYNDEGTDPRLKYLSKDLFENKEVLDIGCNIGHLTLYIAQYFGPNEILGIDVDERLIHIAQKNTCHHLSTSVCNGKRFPISVALNYGPLVRLPMPVAYKTVERFPNNVSFLQADYVPLDDDPIDDQPMDTILCLRVTKWVHLNFADVGIKRMFKRMYHQLKIGGHLILEPQPWSSYSKKKKLTPLTYANYQNIKLKPDNFCEYLLSDEVGFTSCELIGHPFYSAKGHKSALYLLMKGVSSSPEEHLKAAHHLSTSDSEWASSDEEYHDNVKDSSDPFIHSSVSSLLMDAEDIDNCDINPADGEVNSSQLKSPHSDDSVTVSVTSSVDVYSRGTSSNPLTSNNYVASVGPVDNSARDSVIEHVTSTHETSHSSPHQLPSSSVCAADSTCN